MKRPMAPLLVVLTLGTMMLACNVPFLGSGMPAAILTGTVEAPDLLTETAITAQAGTGTPPGPAEPTQAVPGGPTAQASPTLTFIPPQRTNTPQPCDQAGFIQDVTIPDMSLLAPGQVFTKTWRLRNLGSCTWNANYSLVFFGGDPLGAPSTVKLEGDVSPQSIVDVSIQMQAPAAPGNYISYWKLRSDNGEVFSLPENQPIYVQIVVDPAAPTLTPPGGTPLATPTSTVTPTPLATATATATQAGVPGQRPTLTPAASGVIYDFTANLCRAEWRTASRVLECPGTTADAGYVMRLENPRLETYETITLPVIISYPETIESGVIAGRFPAIPIQRGYHFLATLGCMEGAVNCSVIYQVNYSVNGGEPQNLGQWEQVYDGSVRGIDVDLSPLAGQEVEIILAVLANGEAEQDQAVWINPRILRR